MSASLPSLLASELDTSVEQARKLLTAMIREVRKRARREGVRLPEFGTFREQNGRLTFEPSPSLARAVNHRFEGLDSEDLASAQSNESEPSKENDGPSTITLGYQNSDWSPLDSSEPDGSDSDDDEADTEEFQIPSADEGADTEEFQAPSAASPDPSGAPDRSSGDPPPSESPDPDRSEPKKSKTEDLYPIVDESSSASDSEAEAQSEHERVVDAERSALSGIWNSDSENEDAKDELDQFAFGSEPAPRDEVSSPSVAPEEASDPSPDDPPVSDPSASTAPPPSDAEPSSSPSSDRSSFPRVLVVLLVLLLFGGAAWYILGQQGTVQTPRATFSQLQFQVQDVPLVGTTSEEASSEETEPNASDTEAQSAEEASETASSPSSSDASSAEDPASPDDRDASAQELTPADGGWSIVVGSRTDRAAAESLEEQYREVFLDRGFPVGTLEGQVGNSTRYRVGIGQFQSQDAALAFLEEFEEDLPDGAWVLEL